MTRWAQIGLAGAMNAAMFAPAIALAQASETVRIRAGEHAGYSRVVLDISHAGRWSADRADRRVTLRFTGRDLQFDATQIHPARRARRVLRAEDVRQGADTLLTLVLACDCATNIFALGSEKLVIDVRDEAVSPTASGGESALSTDGDDRRSEYRQALVGGADATPFAIAPVAAPAPATRPAEATPAQTAPAVVSNARMLQPKPVEQAPPTPLEAAETTPEPAAVPTPTPEQVAITAPVDIDEARRHLLEQLTRAAEQGLLKFRPTPPGEMEEQGEAAEDPGEPVIEAAPPEKATVRATPPPEAVAVKTGAIAVESSLTDLNPIATEPQIAARSVFDRDAALGKKSATDTSRFCVSDRHLAITSWAEDAPMADQIPALRARLLGEFDKVDGEAALALARLYVHFGFGVEAEAVLRILEGSGASDAVKEVATLIADFARIVDGRPPAAEGPVARSEDCGGLISVWRLVAGLGDAPDAADLEALASKARIHLRRVLTPRIIEALLDQGELVLAERMYALLARAEGDHGDAFRFAGARLASAEGRIVTAEGAYRALIAANSILTDRALLELAESLLARGAEAPPQLVGDLEAMAFLLRGTPLGRKLRVAEVRLRAGDGALSPTMLRISADMTVDPAAAEDLRYAAQDIWREARQAETDPAEYAISAVRHLDLVGREAEADPARIAAAGELTAIGLPNLALAALAPPLTRKSRPARRAAAAAHLAMLNPEGALAVLEGEEGDEARLLRAEAHALKGAYPAAFASLAETPGDEARLARAAAAWRSGDWAAAAELAENPDRKAMAAFMARNGRPNLSPSGSDVEADGPSAGGEETPRAAFTSESALIVEPSLAGARRALEQAEGAHEFINEVLKDG